MRKVTREVTDAFFNRRPRKCGNTRTDGTTIWLHGNAIARHADNGDIEITLAGWNTPTTRERLSGIGQRLGFVVYRRRGAAYVNTYTRNQDYGADAYTWQHPVEVPTNIWFNPHTYVGQFADK